MREMFPDELEGISSDRVWFSVQVAGARVRIPESLWAVVLCALPDETIVKVWVHPEPLEQPKQPPSYDALVAAEGTTGKDYVVIFKIDENDSAFVRPGKTFNVRPLHHHSYFLNKVPVIQTATQCETDHDSLASLTNSRRQSK